MNYTIKILNLHFSIRRHWSSCHSNGPWLVIFSRTIDFFFIQYIMNMLLCPRPFRILFLKVIFSDDAISFCDYIAYCKTMEYRALLKWKRQGKSELFRVKSYTLTVCPSRVSHKLVWDGTRDPTVQDWWLTTSDVVQFPISNSLLVLFSYK